MAKTLTRHLLPELVELALHLRRSPLVGLAGVLANADVTGDSTAPAAALVARLSVALGHAGGDIVDVSANRTTIERAGPSARAVLEKGCPADLHPSAFPVGSAMTTALGTVLLLWRTGEGSWRLLLRPSFADYVARWVQDATTEFSLPEVP